MNTALRAASGPVIALDTSTAAMAAAVERDGELLGEVQSLAERNHSVHVIAHIKTLLASSRVAPEELAGIIVGNGPGSYTGMRIAVTAAKTLAWCWGKPLVGVSSLEAIAYGAWHRGVEGLPVDGNLAADPAQNREHWVLPIMDARRGQAYCAGFSCRAQGTAAAGWSRFAADGVRLMEQWVDSIVERASVTEDLGLGDKPVIWLAGDLSLHETSAERLVAEATKLGADVRLLPYVMEGRFLAELGRIRLEAGESDDVHTFIPNYTQLTEAEVKLKAKQAGEA
ncbi:MAG: peptidase glycoprotease [Paenibacillus sp.]|nr:peptidase glycoprotease [Paenibacillus sp.]